MKNIRYKNRQMICKLFGHQMDQTKQGEFIFFTCGRCGYREINEGAPARNRRADGVRHNLRSRRKGPAKHLLHLTGELQIAKTKRERVIIFVGAFRRLAIDLSAETLDKSLYEIASQMADVYLESMIVDEGIEV